MKGRVNGFRFSNLDKPALAFAVVFTAIAWLVAVTLVMLLFTGLLRIVELFM